MNKPAEHKPNHSGELNELSGAVHIHTDYSDGGASLATVAAAAVDAGLDFVLLADHDTAGPPEKYGWKDGVFLWRGFERSPVRGREHFLAAGAKEIPPQNLPAQEAVAQVRRQGGWTAVAHPESCLGLSGWKRDPSLSAWPHWEVPVDGVEVWSYLHAWASNLKPWQILRSVRKRREYVLEPSRPLLEKWDRLNLDRKIVGIGSLDNHARWFPLLGIIFPHREIIGALTTHLLLPSALTGNDEGDEALLNAVMISGCSFMARDELAPSRNTRLCLKSPAGEYHPGSTLYPPVDGEITFGVPRKATLSILRNGTVIAHSDDSSSLKTSVSESGVYRAEARLNGKCWILTNHIRIIPGP